jgi:hypothetical protein
MRMNISVPDALAEEVRRRDIAISSVCQRALYDEVRRLRAIEEADDILVYVESEQTDPDPATWPGFDPAKPKLIYQRYPIAGRWEPGWVLAYEAGHEPGGNPNDVFTGGEPGDPPIEWARRVVREAAREREQGQGMEKITVEVGEPSLTVGFTGRWLVEPDTDGTRGGDDAGAYWGVALTQRGRIAVYVAHVNDGWPASLNDYPSLDAAANDGVPEEIIARAAAELGETRVLWRDI